MAVTSINITRVSTNMQHLTLLESLRRNTLRLFLEQNRVATGNRLNAMSEDPATASQALNLTEALERQDQVLANIRHADAFMAATDDAITNLSELLYQARSIASEMVSTTVTQEQRDASAELVQGILNEMVRTGNREYNGMYLFGGTRTTTPPFEIVNGGVLYRGNLSNIFTHVDLDQPTQINMHGADLFGAVSSQVTGYVDLNPTLSSTTRLADLTGAAGTGIQAGSLRISLDSPATAFVVDLSSADTVGNVIDLINQAAAQAGLTTGPGGQFNASINASQGSLQLTSSSGTITVEQVGEGFTARDLGLLNTSGASITGADLQPRLTLTTAIADLFGGAGASLGSIQIRSGATTQTVDLSGAATIQDVLNLINTSGTNVSASINAAGTGIDVVNLLSGVPMTIGEAGGNTADLLGIRSLYGGTLLSSLNGGQGVTTMPGKDDFRIVASDGNSVDVNLDGALTVQDVLDRINAAAGAAGVPVSAVLTSTGNGIQIIDSTGGPGDLRVERLNLSPAIDGLGLSSASLSAGGSVLTASDTNLIRPDSVFTVLQDLYESLKRGDSAGISDAGDRLGDFITQATRMQGIVGARAQAMGTRLDLTESAVLATQKLLSDIKDVDYTEAITKFQQAQTTLQANLMTGSRMLQLSLLDFIQ